MSRKSRLGDLKVYKFDVPYESDVGIVIVNFDGVTTGLRFQLTRCTGPRGFSKAFVESVRWFFAFSRKDSSITNQIFNYLASNFCFKNLDNVPPACHVLVFHVDNRDYDNELVPEIDVASVALTILGTKSSILRLEHARTRLVPIAPPTMKILDCYQSQEMCCLCDKGFPKEDEIVYKTRCDHIFHASCISSYLLDTPGCPVCSSELPTVDIRTLLFS